MKKTLILSAILLIIFQLNVCAQESYGKTLNLGLGVGGYSGYYKYAGNSLPVFTVNYEIDVAKNITLAPFVSIYTFSDKYFYLGRNYSYNEVVIPVGVKGFYYFDDLLELNSNWDIYGAASLGIALVNSKWEQGYTGDKNYYHGGNGIFVDLHLGVSYHFANNLGVFLDLSSGVSTIGLQIHSNK